MRPRLFYHSLSLSLSLPPPPPFPRYRDERKEFLEPKLGEENREESRNEREIDFDGLVVG